MADRADFLDSSLRSSDRIWPCLGSGSLWVISVFWWKLFVILSYIVLDLYVRYEWRRTGKGAQTLLQDAGETLPCNVFGSI